MAVDAVGGEMNAFTTREHTAYYTRLPVAELGFGLDLLADVVGAPGVPAPEIDAEREVILEEILMNEDTPDDVVHTRLLEAVFPDHPLGSRDAGHRGRRSTAWSATHIAAFHAHWYRPANLVVAAAGDLDHDAGGRAGRRVPGATPRPATGPERDRADPDRRAAGRWSTARPSRPTWPWPGAGLDHRDPDRYALAVGQPDPRRGDVEPPVPGGPRGARPGLHGLHLARRATPTPGCSRSTPAPRRRGWASCSRSSTT